MGDALATFRGEEIAPLIITPSLVIPPGQIQNITGSTTPCGTMPDVYGDNAYFNTLCVGNTPVPGASAVTAYGAWNSRTIDIPVSATVPFQFAIPVAGFGDWIPIKGIGTQANVGAVIQTPGFYSIIVMLDPLSQVIDDTSTRWNLTKNGVAYGVSTFVPTFYTQQPAILNVGDVIGATLTNTTSLQISFAAALYMVMAGSA